jgi:hypothetical protein
MKLSDLKTIVIEARNYFERIFGPISDNDRVRILGPVMALGAAGCTPGQRSALADRIPPAMQPLILLLAAAKAAEILEDQRMREIRSRHWNAN